MKKSKPNLYLLDTKKEEAAQKEQEGSLQTIEQPQEKNTEENLRTEAEIEEADKKEKRMTRIPFSFFSHIQENRVKYIY